MSNNKENIAKKNLISHKIKSGDKKNNTIKIELELPGEYKSFFEYLNLNFGIDQDEYLKSVIEKEIHSRNSELGIF